MKKQLKRKRTSNIQHPTPNIQWAGALIEWCDSRVSEEPRRRYAARKPAKFDLEERLLEFAVLIVDLTESVPASRSGNHIAGQLLRCGISPYAHHGEVEAAESLKDFIHKLNVCLKELRESRRWLRLLARATTNAPQAQLVPSLTEADELVRIFAASIRTAERRGQ